MSALRSGKCVDFHEALFWPPTPINLYTNDQPATFSRRFIYADDIFRLEVTSFSEIECTLTTDLAHLGKYCQQWRIKPSTSKTVTSVFHLHNVTSRRELDV